MEAVDTREVIAVLESDNLLKVGFDTKGHPVLGLDTFSVNVNGSLKHFGYLDERGKRAMLLIEGQRTFNLKNEIDRRNWNTLKVEMKLRPELEQQIKLIDLYQEAEDEMVAAERLQALINKLMTHKEDGEFLAKVYRKVVGHAGGLTTAVMFRALWTRAKENPDNFLAANKTTWVFESDSFETESLLNLACERGVLIKDGNFFKKADGNVFADGVAKAIYIIENDAAFKNDLMSAVLSPVLDIVPSTEHLIEDSDVLDLINEVGSSDQLPSENVDGSFDQTKDDDKRQVEIETLIDKLIDANIIEQDGDKLVALDLNLEAGSRIELIAQLKVQPELEKTLRSFLDE